MSDQSVVDTELATEPDTEDGGDDVGAGTEVGGSEEAGDGSAAGNIARSEGGGVSENKDIPPKGAEGVMTRGVDDEPNSPVADRINDSIPDQNGIDVEKEENDDGTIRQDEKFDEKRRELEDEEWAERDGEESVNEDNTGGDVDEGNRLVGSSETVMIKERPPASAKTSSVNTAHVSIPVIPKGEPISDLAVLHKQNTHLQTLLHHLESTDLEHRVRIDRLTLDLERVTMHLEDVTAERDEARGRAERDEATVGLLEARLVECEERILSFNHLLDQAIEPWKQKVRASDTRITKLLKEVEALRNRKLQLINKALDAKFGTEYREVADGKYTKLPSIGVAAEGGRS